MRRRAWETRIQPSLNAFKNGYQSGAAVEGEVEIEIEVEGEGEVEGEVEVEIEIEVEVEVGEPRQAIQFRSRPGIAGRAGALD